MTTVIDDLLDLATAGRRLGIDRRFVNILVLEGRLPARRLGQRWYIEAQAFENFAASYARSTRGRAALRPEAVRPLLNLLLTRSGATVRDLAEELSQPRRTVLGWVQMLDEEGLVRRQRGRGSRDPDRCFLTDAGQAFCATNEIRRDTDCKP